MINYNKVDFSEWKVFELNKKEIQKYTKIAIAKKMIHNNEGYNE